MTTQDNEIKKKLTLKEEVDMTVDNFVSEMQERWSCPLPDTLFIISNHCKAIQALLTSEREKAFKEGEEAGYKKVFNALHGQLKYSLEKHLDKTIQYYTIGSEQLKDLKKQFLPGGEG